MSDTDTRFELAGIGAARERRNRPRWMVVLAMLVLIVCLIALFWNISSAATARAALASEQRTATRVGELTETIRTLRAAAEDPETRNIGRPLNDILQRIDRLGTRNNLEVPLARESQSEEDGMVERRYAYRITHPSITDLMTWLSDATERVPGLRVYGLNLTTQGDRAWQLDVTFVRYERAE